MASRQRLSLCMIVRNEEDSLPRCLESVRDLVDEIIVVDTGSEDSTISIAKDFGAKVFSFKWINDFAAARNESLRHATGDYILWLDADDIIPYEERERFTVWKNSLPTEKNKAYWFVVESPEQGEDFFARYATQIRAFPNSPGVKFIRRIHESVIESLDAFGIQYENTDIVIKHIGYKDRVAVEKKAKRNIKMLLTALAEEPNDFVLYWHLSQTYGILKEHERALYYAKKFLEEGNFRGQEHWKVAALVNVGRFYESLGETGEAERYYSEAEREDPQNPMPLFFLARLYYLRGDFVKAKEKLERLKALKPKPTPVPFPLKVAKFYAHLWLGTIYRAEGREDRALEEVSMAMTVNPSWAHREAYAEWGELALKQGKPDLALSFLRGALDREADPNLLSNLGIALRRLGYHGEAEQAFRGALALDPFHFNALANLAHLLLSEGRFYEAEQMFQRALDLDPAAIDLRLGLMLVKAAQRDIEGLLSILPGTLSLLGLELEGEIEDLAELSSLFRELSGRLSSMGKGYEAHLGERIAQILEELDRSLSPSG